LVFVKKEIRNIVWLDKESKFIFLAYMFIPFILLTLSGIPVRDHYFIVAFPMIQILFTLLLSKINLKMVYLVIVLQCIISIQFFYFVNKKDSIQGDYGKPFSKQTFEEKTHYENDTMKIVF
jgi:cytochrome b subunit of formate dehydrogenase